jgi:hypothetical protein
LRYFALIEHELATCLLERECLSLILNSFLEDDVNDSRLCLLLQKVVSVSLLFVEVLSHFSHVVLAAESIAPKLSALSIELSCTLLQILLKFAVVLFKILLSKPLNGMRARWLLD